MTDLEKIEVLQRRLARLERRVFPEDYPPPQPPREPQPGDYLMQPSPRMGDEFLQKRFNLLCRGCFPTKRKREQALEEYLNEFGQELPSRYRDPEDPDVIRDRDSGVDITAQVKAERERERKRNEIDLNHQGDPELGWV